ncbi:MAG: MFS transporter permease [Microbacterium sp.]|uniref:MFS transporter permease n=1 Tax=Microbacterium sp. TaxID=51671 RepID=UPI0039E5CFC7
MWLRRAFFGWLFPAALLLPLWLFVGWIAFNASGWGFLWMLFIAIPSVFVGQLVFTLLVRARGTVRASRAVSWWDVAGFAVWHSLTIALGFFSPASWLPLFIAAIVVGLGLFWLLLWEMLREARPVVLRAAGGMAYLPPDGPPPRQPADPDVIVITERTPGS